MHCDAILKKKETYPSQDQGSRPRHEGRSFFKPWMLLPLVLLAILGYLFLVQKNKSHAVNALDPGAELAIENYLQKGKTNIVDFYSEYCPPCKRISPLLQKLGRKRPDLAILQVDINRKGTQGIDWSSPLARQYELRSVPYFQIYDGKGELRKEGQEAWPEILALLAAAGISM
jgi:thiol-disulfide isomerase/thioredoxin